MEKNEKDQNQCEIGREMVSLGKTLLETSQTNEGLELTRSTLLTFVGKIEDLMGLSNG